MMKSKTLLTFALALLCLQLWAQNDQTFTIRNIEAKRGEAVSGSLIIEEGVDEGTFIPVTIINGEKPGPVLALFAGIHGTEYVPILALQNLAKEVQPEELSGILVLVHVANISAYVNRSSYDGPIDHKNLNRVFPGKKDGTISERIAYSLTNEILKKSDYFIDLHGGEFAEQIVDYVYFYYGCPEGDVCEKSKLLAHATGNKYLIPLKYDVVSDTAQATYSDEVAFRMGIGVATNEWGDMGIIDPHELDAAHKGLINVMRTLNMLEGDYFVNTNPIYLLNEKTLQSKFDGIYYPLVQKAQYVTKGTRLGYLTDFWGKLLEDYRSPLDGIVVHTRNVPATKKGDSMVRVAEVSDTYE